MGDEEPLARERDTSLLDAIHRWGDAFVAYACGLTLADVDRLRGITEPVPVSVNRICVKLVAVERTAHRQSWSTRPIETLGVVAGRLGTLEAGEEHTYLNMMRMAAGGAVPTRDDPDPVLAALRWLARDTLPPYLLLEPRVGGPECTPFERMLGRERLFDHHVLAHPALDAFATAASADPSLASLGAGHATYLVSSVSGAQIMSWPTLAQDLVDAAWEQQLRIGDADPALAVDRLGGVLDEVRSGLGGAELKIPVVVGLRGVGFDELVELEVRGGRLRPSTLAESKLTDEDDPVYLVFETFTSGTLRPSTGLPDSSDFRLVDWQREPWHDARRSALEIGLAVALTSDVSTAPAVSLAWTAVYGLPGEPEREHLAAGRLGEPVGLNQEQRVELARWLKLIRTNGRKLPEQALQRAHSAISNRSLSADALIDAVTAFDALFGGGSALRMQAACAWLLAPSDAAERRQIYERMVAIYELRSASVHEGKAVTRGSWEEVTQLLVRVLRTLIANESLCGDRQRGNRLLLGG